MSNDPRLDHFISPSFDGQVNLGQRAKPVLKCGQSGAKKLGYNHDNVKTSWGK